MGLTRRPNGGSLDALSGGSLVAEPPAAALSGVTASRQVVLLATKLHVPGPLPGFVPRPRGWWRRSLGCSAVLADQAIENLVGAEI